MKRFRKLQKIMAVAVIFTMTLSLVPSSALAVGIKAATQLKGGNGAGTNGEFIYYGNFWQSNASGYTPCGSSTRGEAFDQDNWQKTAIQWRVLSNSSSSGIYVMSSNSLFAHAYNSSSTANWGTSDIRGILQNTSKTQFNDDGTVSEWGGFTGDAFSEAEQGAIAETEHNTIKDTVFLLGESDLKSAYGFGERRAWSSTLGKSVLMYGGTYASLLYPEMGNCTIYWLRTDGSARYVCRDGTVLTNSAANGQISVRPVFNLNSNSILFASAADENTYGGKTAATVTTEGGSFSQLQNYTDKDYKLTIYDNTDAPTLSDFILNASGGSTINFSGAKNGSNTYISGLLSNSSGLVTYGKLANTLESKTGTATIGSYGTTSDSYTLNLFAEQTNGAYETDYASNLSASIPVTFTNGTMTGLTLNSSYIGTTSDTIALSNGFNLTLGGGADDANTTTYN